ncbi:HNH endonuclease [Mesorhizobium sp. WSM3882]|uniref:HNH endonuclease n=1 Tax=Mesorhizobium sp. WSM3882 TaxID=2029407 RepID=UPI00117D4B88|nr:HNH endonuclease [Mesorhizobium sp. WSM3882]
MTITKLMVMRVPMADPYLPALDSVVFTNAEKDAIAAALATDKPWDWKPGGEVEEALKSVKKKILDLHMARHGDRCCFCRKNMKGGGPFVIDREHVLPKSLPDYKVLAYEMWNLGISCKRCNMGYKKRKVDFVVDAANPAALQSSANYRLIHPNYDLYKDHIRISSTQDDDTTIVKYTRTGSEKGQYTYDYFNLRELEVGSFDEAQGGTMSEGLGQGALQARLLAAEYDQ